MTLSEYFDTTLNTDANIRNETTLKESYKLKVLGRMIVLNCKHKSVKNDIQHMQTHARLDVNGVVELLWPNNISKSLAMVMMLWSQA